MLTNIKILVVSKVLLFRLPAYGLWTNETQTQSLEIRTYKKVLYIDTDGL